MDYLGTDIEWVAGLLANSGMPMELLYDYLQAYFQSLRQQLDEHGRPIVDWWGQMLSGYPPG